jgi:hypothetical protein
MHADREARARVLIGALAWRTRREGLVFLLAPFVPFAVISGGLITLAVVDSAAINGRDTFTTVASRYGASADAVSIGVALVIVPGMIAVFTAAAAGLVIRNVVGSEAGRGSIEALLAAPYRPRSIVVALLGYIGSLATMFWAGMTALGALGLVVVTDASGGHLRLSGTYALLVLALPLLAAWAGTALSLLVSLLYPRLTQPGQLSIAVNGSGLSGGAVLLPAVGVTFVFSLGAAHARPEELLAIAGGATAAITVGSVLIVGRRFRPENVLES